MDTTERLFGEELPLYFNLRDLGGLRTADGRRTMPGKLFRGASLHRLGPADLELVSSLGIRTALDLRTAAEVERGTFPGVGTEVRHLPVFRVAPAFDHSTPELADRLADGYAAMLEPGAAAIRDALRILSAEEPYPAIIYCAAGKDRTGILCALILELVGVTREEIAADFARSDAPARALREWWESRRPNFRDPHPAEIYRAPEAAIIGFLARRDERFGSPDGYLESIGIDPAEARAGLSAQLLEGRKSRSGAAAGSGSSTPRRFEFRGRGDVTLVGEEWRGDPARPEIVLLHGGGQTRRSWQRTAEAFAADGWPVRSFDWRGHGESEWAPDGDYSVDAFLADLLALPGAGPPPIFVGASLGGIVGLLAASEVPGSAGGIALIDISLRIEQDAFDRIREFMTAHPDGFESLDQAADAIAAYDPSRPRRSDTRGLSRSLRRRDDGRWVWHWDPRFMSVSDERESREHAARMRAAAAALSVPALAVRGGRSEVVSDAGLEELHRLIPHLRSVDVPSAGHTIAGDDNNALVGSLRSFLREEVSISC